MAMVAKVIGRRERFSWAVIACCTFSNLYDYDSPQWYWSESEVVEYRVQSKKYRLAIRVSIVMTSSAPQGSSSICTGLGQVLNGTRHWVICLMTWPTHGNCIQLLAARQIWGLLGCIYLYQHVTMIVPLPRRDSPLPFVIHDWLVCLGGLAFVSSYLDTLVGWTPIYD